MSDTYRGLCATWREALHTAHLWVQESGRRMRVHRGPLTPGGAMAVSYGQDHGWWVDEVEAPSLADRLADAHIAEAKRRAGLEVTA